MTRENKKNQGKTIWLTTLGIVSIIYLFDFFKFRTYFNANIGFTYAMMDLAEYNWNRRKGDKAFYWYQRAANRGNIVAMFGCYQTAPTVELRKKWCIIAAEKGNKAGLVELSNNYLYGTNGFERDYDRGSYWLYRYDCFYADKPRPVTLSFEDWKRERDKTDPTAPTPGSWLESQANRGSVTAMMIIAEGAESRHTDRWDKMAVHWYQRAARNGDLAARRRLATAYQEGQLGLPKDPGQAKHWHDLWQESEAKEKVFRRGVSR